MTDAEVLKRGWNAFTSVWGRHPKTRILVKHLSLHQLKRRAISRLRVALSLTYCKDEILSSRFLAMHSD